MSHEQLVRKRGTVKAKLTNLEKYIINLEISYPDYKVDDFNIFLELEQRVDRFQSILDEFEDPQGQIEEISDNLEAQYVERETFEKAYFSVLARAKRFLINNPITSNDNGGSSQGSTRSSGSGTKEGVSGVKLPVIEIMSFNGEFDKWLEFRDTYQSLIHQNSSLSQIQKYHYLRAYLGASVLEIIASLEFSASNYESAWKLICDRFNNSRILIQNHVKALFTINKIETESSCDLRKLVDSVAKHLRALKTLNEPTESWDTLVIYLVTTKLDEVTHRKWEQLKASYKTPTLEQLSKFLKERADLLESLGQSNDSQPSDRQPKKRSKVLLANSEANSFLSNYSSNKPKCSFCKRDHYIQVCSDFLKLNLSDRVEQAKKKRLCLNCLRSGHIYKQCYSGPCKSCKLKHHTLLHKEGNNDKANNSESLSNDKDLQQESVNLSSHNVSNNQQVLLSTALVSIVDKNNKIHKARALLDAGSQSSFLTERFCADLNLHKLPVDVKISGFNETQSQCKGKCVVRVQSKVNKFSTEICCLIVPQITGNLPNFKVHKRNLKFPENVKLADPCFDIPGDIDMLIGADHFWDLMCVGQVKLSSVGPYLQKTKFGWVVSGPIENESNHIIQCNLLKHDGIDKQLTRFWEIEEFPGTKPLSFEEKACERHFLETFKRDSSERFVVTIPLVENTERLGDSYDSAEKRLLSLERKFDRNDGFKTKYFDFIREYIRLGHMSKVEHSDENNDISKHAYYMPHHGVLKESSLTTKLRVVFDASCPSSTGYSFNDLQMTGPTIQSDLLSILLRHRKHNFVIAADVEKMYRMCLINPDQKCFQRILWRDDPKKPIDTYELLTVTYGTKSAAFLAIRCLYQLGIECETMHPLASQVIKEDFYVDDMLTGSDTVENTISLANEVSMILSKAGFHLRKWVSNSAQVLQGIQVSDNADIIDLGANENTKTLGLLYNGQNDSFVYKIGINFNKHVTKRTVLSEISQVFDPLGLLSASIILAKIILRDIWLEKLSWDSSLPHALHTRWLQFRDELTYLTDVQIERQVTCKNPVYVEIHGFSDSSAYAYGACVYIKSRSNNGDVSVKLICAKSKVAPLKIQTIPRLELTAALLLARLVDKVKVSLNMHIDNITYWCDSTIVLGWLSTSPSSLQVFVANRVSSIQELSNPKDWRHVPTQDNPADYVSRGIRPSDLPSLQIYWFGPSWLAQDSESWPNLHISDTILPEMRKTVAYACQVSEENPLIDFKNYSTLNKLERTVAYCLRFKENCLTAKENRDHGVLKTKELNKAASCLIRMSQQQCFKNDLSALIKRGRVGKGSKLSKLNPFVDENNILRVGGRLTNSEFDFGKKFPILLSSKHHLTKLLFKQEHIRLFHAGPQLLLSSIRERFWPISGRNLARKIYHDCVRCFKVNPLPITPMMGNLPSTRVNPAPPFLSTGVDYAGPFMIRDRQGRGFKVTKAYICLFVCFVTRAVHLECVSDLTTEAFLAALRRFVSRRGKPAQMFSDNGTNFVGANQELRELGVFLQKNSENLTESIENDGISWSFIPPHSPHFGGLWEAGVKATKFHLKRVASNALLTFERFYTVLVQIEGVLNSRPMYPLSCDPSDYTPLTPSHFLIGRPMTSVPEPDFMQTPENRLSHFQQVQRLQQHFWSRWSREYISELQQRAKWRNNYDTLKINDLVVIKDDNLPTCKWLLGRIENLHPGKDGTSRVATIRTKRGTLKRSFSKICPLPMN